MASEKIHVVVPSVDYEGYNLPLLAFKDPEMATKFAEVLDGRLFGDSCEAEEIMLFDDFDEAKNWLIKEWGDAQLKQVLEKAK
jgi:hypothetical protein